MPVFNNVKVVGTPENVWSTPDGKRNLYKVGLEVDGKEVAAKTWSEAIAKEGWSGDIETYEKDGKMGSETFVRQAPKEGFSGGGGYSGGGQSKGGGDSYAMFQSYAKDLAIALLDDKGNLDEDKYSKLLDAVAMGGEVLYESRPGGKVTKKEEPAGKSDSSEQTVEDIEDLNKIFGDK